MDYELERNPFEYRKEAIREWRNIASKNITEESPEILELALQLKKQGIKSYDALHIACANSAGCEYFITTDKQLYRVLLSGMKIVNPI